MVERRCGYCERVFQPSKFQPEQSVCSQPECQQRRRVDYHRQRIASDAEYRQGCQDSSRKWRTRNPGYWRRRREGNAAIVERNRQQQRVRDQKRRLRDLANNNVLASIRFPPDKGKRAMLSTEQINDLHRLYWSEHWPIRKIERHLRMGWHTIRKYLDAPAQGPVKRSRRSKLDPFKSTIAEWLQKDAKVSGTVIEQRLRPLGYTGGPTILRNYLQKARSEIKSSRAFVRVEPTPGERFEVDWGHFGALDYCGDKRKLYAFALVETHSRMLYLEFTHSQSFETFVRCHIHAFLALGGAREIAPDFVPGNKIEFLWRIALCGRTFQSARLVKVEGMDGRVAPNEPSQKVTRSASV
jgi:hypothetical protein